MLILPSDLESASLREAPHCLGCKHWHFGGKILPSPSRGVGCSSLGSTPSTSCRSDSLSCRPHRHLPSFHSPNQEPVMATASLPPPLSRLQLSHMPCEQCVGDGQGFVHTLRETCTRRADGEVRILVTTTQLLWSTEAFPRATTGTHKILCFGSGQTCPALGASPLPAYLPDMECKKWFGADSSAPLPSVSVLPVPTL